MNTYNSLLLKYIDYGNNRELYQSIQDIVRNCNTHLKSESCEMCHIFTMFVRRIDTEEGLLNTLLFPFEVELTQKIIEKIDDVMCNHSSNIDKIIEYGRSMIYQLSVARVVHTWNRQADTYKHDNPIVVAMFDAAYKLYNAPRSFLYSTDISNKEKFELLVKEKLNEYRREVEGKAIYNEVVKARILEELYSELIDTPFGHLMMDNEKGFLDIILVKLHEVIGWIKRSSIHVKRPEFRVYINDLIERLEKKKSVRDAKIEAEKAKVELSELHQEIESIPDEIDNNEDNCADTATIRTSIIDAIDKEEERKLQESSSQCQHSMTSDSDDTSFLQNTSTVDYCRFKDLVSGKLQKFTLNEKDVTNPDRLKNRISILYDIFTTIDTPVGNYIIKHYSQFRNVVVKKLLSMHISTHADSSPEAVALRKYMDEYNERITKNISPPAYNIRYAQPPRNCNCAEKDNRKRVSKRSTRNRHVPSQLECKEVFVEKDNKYYLFWEDYCKMCKHEYQEKYDFHKSLVI